MSDKKLPTAAELKKKQAEAEKTEAEQYLDNKKTKSP